MKKSENMLLTAVPNASWMVHSPGKVDLLGDHADSTGGVVLAAAIDRYVTMAAEPRGDDLVIVHALDIGEVAEFSLKNLDSKRDVHGNSLPNWALFPASVAWAFQQAGFNPGGMEAAYYSDIPDGLGLGSSAALELAFAEYWKTVGEWKVDRMRMAKLCRDGENAYLGNANGLTDQFACAHGVARCALFFDTFDFSWQPIPIPLNTSLVIVDPDLQGQSLAALDDSRREECRQVLNLIQVHKTNINKLSDLSSSDLVDVRQMVPENLARRVQFVVEENERVRQACRCLIADDAAGFGELLTAGHASLRDLYEASVPELDALVTMAVGIEGCYGARLTAAENGGCIVAFVNSSLIEPFSNTLLEKAGNVLNSIPKLYACKPSRSVRIQPITDQKMV